MTSSRLAGIQDSDDPEALALVLNGEQRTISRCGNVTSLEELLASLCVRREMVAIALNEDIVPRSQWNKTLVQSGDRVEIVHFVGGGSALSS